MGADRERLSKGDTHPPSSGHVLGRLGHHLGTETETVENRSSLGLERGRVEVLELLVLHLESNLVHNVRNRHLLDKSLDTGSLVTGRLDNVVECRHVRRLDLSLDEVDLNTRKKIRLSA